MRGFKPLRPNGHLPYIPLTGNTEEEFKSLRLRQARVKFNSVKGKTAFIGPGVRLPAEEPGRGLSERSEFRSPRRRQRRPSE